MGTECVWAWPPSRSSASNSVTRLLPESTCAAVNPATPLPTTATLEGGTDRWRILMPGVRIRSREWMGRIERSVSSASIHGSGCSRRAHDRVVAHRITGHDPRAERHE
ncbi:Uncharacterised protein [Mycobacteroides abscessus subsp. abscessus]|nr:Uncharacterised protein [Mycobacteroides abscessus subsp. abscessus]